MANSLLDFVMSLVRDPDAAARYAADPAQTIADAHLANVTSVDVDNLIPVVSESLSTANSTASFDGFGAEPVSNVWASGAATSAFDAFDDHAFTPTVVDTPPVITDTVDSFATSADVPSGIDWADDLASVHLDTPVVTDDILPADHGSAGVWEQPLTEDQPVEHPDAFDLFD